MKTISLEVEERIYPQVVNFLRLLPKDSCQVFEEENDTLSPEEQSAVQAIQSRLQTGDVSEFENWEAI